MNSSQIYILLSIIVLAVVMAVLVLTRRKIGKPLSLLAGLAFAFIIAGIAFGENRLVGYGLMGVGILLAVIDIINKSKTKKESESKDSLETGEDKTTKNI